MLRLGLFIYDHLGGRKLLPPTKTIDLTHHEVGVPLKRRFKYGFQYSDCWVDDARLVVLNALDAAERGAIIRTRTQDACGAERSDHWRLVLNARGNREVVTARVLVNAAGPWVGRGRRETICGRTGRRARVSSRAAISWCSGCSIMTAPIFSRIRTGAWCSPFPSRPISR